MPHLLSPANWENAIRCYLKGALPSQMGKHLEAKGNLDMGLGLPSVCCSIQAVFFVSLEIGMLGAGSSPGKPCHD